MGIQQMMLGSAGGITPITATGGSKATPGDGYIYHHFTSPGNFQITDGNAEMDILIVGGGGGGGKDRGGGGGAGAFRPVTLDGVPGTHPITIGAGGAKDPGGPPSMGSPGGDTTFTFDSTAYIAGGGGAASGDGASRGGVSIPEFSSFPIGGSGGGTTGSPIGACPWPGGNAGIFGFPGKGSNESGTGGGGGGAGSGGPNAPSPSTSTTAFVGGDGKTLPWIPTSYGVSGYFSGGGGGGGRQYPYPSPSPTTPAAPGGGGKGGQDSPAFSATDGTANTGGGGGGGDGGGTPHRDGGNGGSGTVLIRYEAP